MDLGLQGRVALVMGASRGLGHAAAESLAREGARVAIAGRDRGRIEAARERAPEIAAAYVADTADVDALPDLVATVTGELGPIDVLVTNTGGPPAGKSLDNSDEQWQRAYESLVLAPRALITAALPSMLERGWGRIINIGSTATIEPTGGLTLSNVHRAGIVALFKTLADEVAGKGVTVNTVATGRFATDRLAELFGSLEAAEQRAAEIVPVGRLGFPAEYGDLVAFLASDRASFLTGTTIALDGGATRRP